MDRDVLNAILGSYSKILSEISEIKKMIAAGKAENEGKRNMMLESFVLNSQFSREHAQRHTKEYASECSVSRDKGVGQDGAAERIAGTSNVRQRQISSVSSSKSDSAVRRQIGSPVMACRKMPMKCSTQSNYRSFDPDRGFEIERCLSQGVDNGTEPAAHQSQCVRKVKKRSQVQESYSFSKSRKNGWDFFNNLEKEIEEAL